MLFPIRIFISVLCLFFLSVGVAVACESYDDYSTDELKELRGVLNNAEADPFDRMEALERMACSDSPNIRHYAFRQGLLNIEEPFLRNEIMLKALMEKKRVDVELGSSKEMTKDDKAFVTRHAEVYSGMVAYRSQSVGCIVLGSRARDSCDTGSALVISGDRVELNHGNVSGLFRLSREGELVGTLRAQNHSKYTRIPAVIKLF